MIAILLAFVSFVVLPLPSAQAGARTLEVAFRSHDEHEMFGKLTLPAGTPRAVVVYVQTAEGMTVDMRRPSARGGTFDYFELYRAKLPALQLGFFSYEGRGIRMGDAPPRYETIERARYDTSTLANKVEDALAAVRAVRAQPELAGVRVLLLGASEGTLLAAQAAARAPDEIQGLALYGVMAENMRATFRYILSDGAFLAYRGYFDADQDGRITPAEFEADPRRFRAHALGDAAFEALDKDGDGLLLLPDLVAQAQPLLDAVAQENFELLDRWAQLAAGVSTPKDWFRDHFAQPPLWDSLAPLDIPVGFFHGGRDTNTPIAAVQALEQQALAAGKSQFLFEYFSKADHSLNIASYFVNGSLPDGHAALFAFLDEAAGGR
jgi:pimeloyl-ACP methyl ester carboxylesterase